MAFRYDSLYHIFIVIILLIIDMLDVLYLLNWGLFDRNRSFGGSLRKHHILWLWLEEWYLGMNIRRWGNLLLSFVVSKVLDDTRLEGLMTRFLIGFPLYCISHFRYNYIEYKKNMSKRSGAWWHAPIHP